MSAIPRFNPLRTLQDAHLPECCCRACCDADPETIAKRREEAEEAEFEDCERDAYDIECDEADTRNDSVRS